MARMAFHTRVIRKLNMNLHLEMGNQDLQTHLYLHSHKLLCLLGYTHYLV